MGTLPVLLFFIDKCPTTDRFHYLCLDNDGEIRLKTWPAHLVFSHTILTDPLHRQTVVNNKVFSRKPRLFVAQWIDLMGTLTTLSMIQPWMNHVDYTTFDFQTSFGNHLNHWSHKHLYLNFTCSDDQFREEVYFESALINTPMRWVCLFAWSKVKK